MENEIQGGEKRYNHQTYGLVAGSLVNYGEHELRFHKRPWVPMWLFKFFATPDYVDLVDRALATATKKLDTALLDSLAEPGERTRG